MPARNTESEGRTRLLCLFRILRDRTDYAHPLTTEQIRVILQEEAIVKEKAVINSGLEAIFATQIHLNIGVTNLTCYVIRNQALA